MSILAFSSNKSAGGGGPGTLVVTLSQNFLGGRRTGFGTITTQSPVTASVTGGIPPYTGTWTYESGDSEIYPTSAGTSTKFAAFADLIPIEYVGEWKYSVTDAMSNTGDSPLVTITLTANLSTGGREEFV